MARKSIPGTIEDLIIARIWRANGRKVGGQAGKVDKDQSTKGLEYISM